VLLRLEGRFYQLTQEELRTALELPRGLPSLGITVDRGRFHFEFAADNQSVVVSSRELQRRLARHVATK